MDKVKYRVLESNTIEVIAHRIKELRKLSGKERKEVASDLFMEYKTWSRIENGERNLSPQEIADISTYFNISCDELLRGEKPEYFKIENMTGLSQKSIDYLSFSREINPHLNEILDAVLEDKEKADTLLNALYIYATSEITFINVAQIGLINKLAEKDYELKKRAIWSSVENYIFTVCEKIRVDSSDKFSRLMDQEINKIINEMLANTENMKK